MRNNLRSVGRKNELIDRLREHETVVARQQRVVPLAFASSAQIHVAGTKLEAHMNCPGNVQRRLALAHSYGSLPPDLRDLIMAHVRADVRLYHRGLDDVELYSLVEKHGFAPRLQWAETAANDDYAEAKRWNPAYVRAQDHPLYTTMTHAALMGKIPEGPTKASIGSIGSTLRGRHKIAAFVEVQRLGLLAPP